MLVDGREEGREWRAADRLELVDIDIKSSFGGSGCCSCCTNTVSQDPTFPDLYLFLFAFGV